MAEEFDKSKHPMATIEGKGNRFVPKGESGDTGTQELSGLPSANSTIKRAERVVGQIEPINKSDYASIRSEVFRKQSQQGYIKKRDYAYSANDFYVFDNGDDIGSFTIVTKLPIVGNEELINHLWRWLDKNG